MGSVLLSDDTVQKLNRFGELLYREARPIYRALTRATFVILTEDLVQFDFEPDLRAAIEGDARTMALLDELAQRVGARVEP